MQPLLGMFGSTCNCKTIVMGYKAFNIEVDDEGYPEWHQNRVKPSYDNPTPIHCMDEFSSAYREFQQMWVRAVAGNMSKRDRREWFILAKRLHNYRVANNIKVSASK